MDVGDRMCGGRRWSRREKSGEGKTVRALTRMLVVGSSRVRWGLNWYLGNAKACQHGSLSSLWDTDRGGWRRWVR